MLVGMHRHRREMSNVRCRRRSGTPTRVPARRRPARGSARSRWARRARPRLRGRRRWREETASLAGATRAPSIQRRAVPAPVSTRSDTGSVRRLSTTSACRRTPAVWCGCAGCIHRTRATSGCAGSRRSQVDCRCSAVSVAAAWGRAVPSQRRELRPAVSPRTRDAPARTPPGRESRSRPAPPHATVPPRSGGGEPQPVGERAADQEVPVLPLPHAIDGRHGMVPSDTRAGAESSPSAARNHVAPGRGGSIVIDTAGALSSTPIAPVDRDSFPERKRRQHQRRAARAWIGDRDVADPELCLGPRVERAADLRRRGGVETAGREQIADRFGCMVSGTRTDCCPSADRAAGRRSASIRAAAVPEPAVVAHGRWRRRTG